MAPLFPRYNINWNYGLLPQTWEDPSLANPEVDGAFGDNDPGNFESLSAISVLRFMLKLLQYCMIDFFESTENKLKRK